MHIPDIRYWTEQHVAEWLTECQFGHYAGIFIENDVNGEVLIEITNTLLKELGVRTVGERVRILVALKRLRQACVNAARSALQDEASGVGTGRSTADHFMDGSASMPTPEKSSKLSSDKLKPNTIRVSGPGDQICTVDVRGITDAQSVLIRVLQKFHIDVEQLDLAKYRLFVPTVDGSSRMLPDDELMEICNNTDRAEKNRLVLRIKQQRQRGNPSDSGRRQLPPMPAAIEPAVSPALSPGRTSSFFGERPASEMISNNLSDFFPSQQQEVLETVTENRIRHTIYRKAKRVTMMRAARAPTISYPADRMSGNEHDTGIRDDDGTLIVPDKHAEILDKRRLTREDISELVDEKMGDDELDAFTEMLMNDDAMAEEEQKKVEGITQWIKGSMIGTGSFGNVYLGLNPLTGELLAAKQVELPDSSGSDERREVMLKALQREIDLLKDLDHENIVRYLGSHRDEQHLNIFLEYVPGGSVASMLGNYGPFQESLVKSYLRQILLGLEYLHGQGIIHRDIKGGNILVDNRGVIKISDFGVSKRDETGDMISGSATHRESLQGSVFWMAPEVVKKQHYTPKADVWSLGCLVVEMFTGEHPFPKLAQMQAIFKIGSDKSPEIPQDVSEEAQDFLRQTFQLETESRPSASKLLLHSFVASPPK